MDNFNLWIRTNTRALFLSKTYTVLCVLLVLFNIGMLCWEIFAIVKGDSFKLFNHTYGKEFYIFLACEIILNFCLFVDIILRILAQQPFGFFDKCSEYTKYWGNIADVVILLFSLAALFVFVFGSLYFEIIGEGLTIVVACFRWAILFLRIMMTLKNQTLSHSTEKIEISSSGENMDSRNRYGTIYDDSGAGEVIEDDNIFDSDLIEDPVTFSSFRSIKKKNNNRQTENDMISVSWARPTDF